MIDKVLVIRAVENLIEGGYSVVIVADMFLELEITTDGATLDYDTTLVKHGKDIEGALQEFLVLDAMDRKEQLQYLDDLYGED